MAIWSQPRRHTTSGLNQLEHRSDELGGMMVTGELLTTLPGQLLTPLTGEVLTTLPGELLSL